ncbi:hypothetical protein KFU94_17350 [Chloroflexi bacterium TSY]|nr:hypothetical protein [Chloroflexi bacterium TSY]
MNGQSGFAFFLQEALLEKRLADQVDLVGRGSEGIEQISKSDSYDLVVINLVDAWEQSIELGFWLSQQPSSCPVILVVAPELSDSLPSDPRFLVLSAPVSLNDFIKSVRTVLGM